MVSARIMYCGRAPSATRPCLLHSVRSSRQRIFPRFPPLLAVFSLLPSLHVESSPGSHQTRGKNLTCCELVPKAPIFPEKIGGIPMTWPSPESNGVAPLPTTIG
jgi:hypothetical protein